ncbi:hypothetical protein Acr_11g0013840 [Actinidia rufa]|uniref:Uncharacterized protein n=1 Tax=Actinidia rufa TaxID=165716 RepID=A0A7J0FEI2_9ERIC|nr:hypothetical protein Acr_11g0013840 [Actinidia rufa]
MEHTNLPVVAKRAGLYTTSCSTTIPHPLPPGPTTDTCRSLAHTSTSSVAATARPSRSTSSPSATKHNSHSNFFACAHAPATEDDAVTVNEVKRALEMLNSEEAAASPGFWQSPAVRDLIYSELSSPALPGFGRTPAVRQLRITDSPFPLRDVDEDSHVDKAAEEFIDRFYKDLRKQNRMALR